jgi:hypothetical protein
MVEGAREVAHRFHGHSMGIALCLNDVLSADHRLLIVSDAVNTAIAGGPCLIGIEPHRLKEVFDHGLE